MQIAFGERNGCWKGVVDILVVEMGCSKIESSGKVEGQDFDLTEA